MRTSRRVCVYCKARGRTAVARWNADGFWFVLCEACGAISSGAKSNFAAHEAFEATALGRHAEVLVRAN